MPLTSEARFAFDVWNEIRIWRLKQDTLLTSEAEYAQDDWREIGFGRLKRGKFLNSFICSALRFTCQCEGLFEFKWFIVKLHNSGLGYEEIQKRISVSQNTLAKIIQTYEKIGVVSNDTRSCRHLVDYPRCSTLLIMCDDVQTSHCFQLFPNGGFCMSRTSASVIFPNGGFCCWRGCIHQNRMSRTCASVVFPNGGFCCWRDCIHLNSGSRTCASVVFEDVLLLGSLFRVHKKHLLFTDKSAQRLGWSLFSWDPVVWYNEKYLILIHGVNESDNDLVKKIKNVSPIFCEAQRWKCSDINSHILLQ